ncbi:hypothetical protein ACEN4P_07030 [Marinilactibacillus psychrotolerans]|uniref:Uncharacterized protein n=1 Tax=Marinilactibacillus psychrotolerans TaxID=191770 RepID=A0ABW8UHC8_9LACT
MKAIIKFVFICSLVCILLIGLTQSGFFEEKSLKADHTTIQSAPDNVELSKSIESNTLIFRDALSNEEIQKYEYTLGEQLANIHNNNYTSIDYKFSTLNTISATSWVQKTTKNLSKNELVEVGYMGKVDRNSEETYQLNFKFEPTNTINGIELTTNFNYSKSIICSGPTGGTVAATDIKASHAYFTAAIWGYVKEYTYDVINNRSGKIVGTEKVTAFIRTDIQVYAQNAFANKDGSILIENTAGNKSKTLSYTIDFINGIDQNETTLMWW